MQVYVHLAGKNHGPYSIDQLRQYVQAGNFKDDHLACYDGTNWVKIKDVPGVAKALRDSREFEATETWEEGVIGDGLDW